MPSGYTPSLRLILPATGELTGTWGDALNAGFTERVEEAIAGTADVAIADVNVLLTTATDGPDQARSMVVRFTGALTAQRDATIPAASKLYLVLNDTTGGFGVRIKTASGAGVVVPAGARAFVYCNGVDTVTALNAVGLAQLGMPATAVTYTATGSATQRTGAQKFSEIKTPNDFGAVGDGVADDTAAWTLFEADTAFKIVLPGSYKVNGTVRTFTSAQVYSGNELQTVLRQVSAFLIEENTDQRGDELPNYMRRILEIRRRVGETLPYETVAEKHVNAGGAAYCLRYFARAAELAPGAYADAYMPHILKLADTLLGLQHEDPRRARFGGIAVAPKDGTASLHTSAFAGLALLATYRVTQIPDYLTAAKRIATFIQTLHDPNPVYETLYGQTPIPAVPQNAGWGGVCDTIGPSDVITVAHTTWNVRAAQFLKELYEVTGDAAYQTLGNTIRDFGAMGVTGFYDFWAVYHSGALPSMVSNNWFGSGLEANDGQWHRRGELVLSGGLAVNTIGSDQVENGIEALYAAGYDVPTLKTAYDLLIAAPNADGGAFGTAYDSAICWPGYFRPYAPVYGGVTKAFGAHYDTQGIGPLLKWKRDQYPAHFARSFNVALRIGQISTFIDQNFEVVWSSDPSGLFQYTSKGTGTVLGVVALGCLEALYA